MIKGSHEQDVPQEAEGTGRNIGENVERSRIDGRLQLGAFASGTDELLHDLQADRTAFFWVELHSGDVAMTNRRSDHPTINVVTRQEVLRISGL